MVCNTSDHESQVSHLSKNDLGYPSDILENSFDEADEAMNTQEPSIEKVNFTNQIPVLLHYSPIKEKYQGEPDDNTKPSEEEVYRNEIAKANLLMITHSRKTCSRCPICNLLTLTRKEALLHLKISHPETNAAHTKLPRIHLHRKKTCTNCKRNDSSNLINLTA